MSVITLNKNNFKKEVLDYKGMVLVDFWADWCGPCQMLAPVIHEVADNNEGTVKVGKVNVDEEMEVAQEYRISGIPALILFKDGKPVNQSIGYIDRDKIEAMWK